MRKNVESSKGNNGKSKFGNSMPGKSARGKPNSSIGSAHVLSNEEKMRIIEDSAKQLNQPPPRQSVWTRFAAAFSSMMQRFSDWLDGLMPRKVVVVEEYEKVPSQNNGGATTVLLKKMKADKQAQQKTEDNFFQRGKNVAKKIKTVGENLANQVVDIATNATVDDEVIVLRNSAAYSNLVAHLELLSNDTRPHSFFGYSLKEPEKAKWLGDFVTDIKNATFIEDVDAAFDNYEKKLKPYLNIGQNITTKLLWLPTTSVSLVEALREERNHPTVNAIANRA